MATTTTTPTTNKTRGGTFAPTRWTVVLTAGRETRAQAQNALEELCRAYWYPLYAYVRRRGYSSHDAQDLTQEFFARLLEKEKLAGLTREGGKFRSFLLTALNHFLVDEWKRASARRRGGAHVISLDAASAETQYRLEPKDTLTPERIFEQSWALALLESVFQRLQHEQETAGKGAQFAELKFCLTGERSALPYAELASRLALSESALKVTVHRLRQRYRELLREEVAHTVTSPAEVEEELRELFRALAG